MRKSLILIATAAAVVLSGLFVAAPAQAAPKPYPVAKIWNQAFNKQDRRDFCEIVDWFGVRGTRQFLVQSARQEFRQPDSHKGKRISHQEKRAIETFKRLPRWTVQTGKC